MEAVGAEEDNPSKTALEKASKKAREILQAAGGDTAKSGRGNVVCYEHFVRFVNVNRKRLHKFVFFPEPHRDQDYTYRAVYMIPADAAEKVLVLGWPRPADPQT